MGQSAYWGENNYLFPFTLVVQNVIICSEFGQGVSNFEQQTVAFPSAFLSDLLTTPTIY